MDSELKKRGRPEGTIKTDKSPRKKLDTLRTKTWAWSCLHFLRTERNTYFLEQESIKVLAGAYPSRVKDKNGKWVTVEPDMVDATRWGRWLDGERSTSRPGGHKEIRNKDAAKRGKKGELVTTFPRTALWPETHPAYHIGPWVDDGSEDSKFGCGGTFMPLWSALSGEMEQLREDWFKVPLDLWEKWDPDHMQEKYFFGVTKKDPGRRSGFQDLYELACRLAQPNKYIPPLVSFTACLTAARICGDNKIMLFEPDINTSSVPVGRQSRYIILSEMRDRLFEDLSKINISFQEIIDVASDHGLTIYDFYKLGDLGDDFSRLAAEMNDDFDMLAADMGIDASLLIAENPHMLASYIYNYLCIEREGIW